MQQEVTFLEVDWTESVGPQSSVGSPYLVVWFRAAFLEPGPIADGQVVVLARDEQSGAWTQLQAPVTEVEALTLIGMFSGVGVPGRAPDVIVVPDTSDTFHIADVRVSVGGPSQTFAVQAQCSGFRGPDADGLRAVLGRILDASGYGRERSMFA